MIVVNKPVGMVVHPAPGHPDGTLVNALLYHCGKYPLWDQRQPCAPASSTASTGTPAGLIIAAKNDRAHLALAAQLQDHSLSPGLRGGVRWAGCGRIAAPWTPPSADTLWTGRGCAVDRQNGREAVTHWRVLARYPGFTHVECRLETGRTHQIRVHLASIGHPLLGDVVYGGKKPVPGLAGQCLHARRLRFTHPSTGQLVELECPLPGWFQDVLDRLSRLN